MINNVPPAHRAQFMKEIRMLKEKGKPESGKERDASGLLAAMKIQKMWRGFATRKRTRRRKIEEMILIGMNPPPPSKFREQQLQLNEQVREGGIHRQRVSTVACPISNLTRDVSPS